MRPLSRRAFLGLSAALPVALRAARVSGQTATGHGLLLIAHDHVIALRDLAAGAEQTLITLPSAAFPRLPVWLPDGSGFFYAQQGVNTGAPGGDYGTDLWRADATGGNRQLLWQHDARAADIAGLALTADSTALLFGYSRIDISPAGTIAGQALRLDRFDIGSGALTPLREGAVDPAVARDGTIAYVDATAEPAIWALPPGGGPPLLLLSAGSAFYSFFSPRFSPDGSRLLFAAAPASSAFGSAGVARYNAARRPLDGPPQDIFTVTTDGNAVVTRLTAIQEDQPAAAWSADGSQVVVVGSEGVFLAAADGSGVVRLGDGYLHSQCAWLDR